MLINKSLVFSMFDILGGEGGDEAYEGKRWFDESSGIKSWAAHRISANSSRECRSLLFVRRINKNGIMKSGWGFKAPSIMLCCLSSVFKTKQSQLQNSHGLIFRIWETPVPPHNIVCRRKLAVDGQPSNWLFYLNLFFDQWTQLHGTRIVSCWWLRHALWSILCQQAASKQVLGIKFHAICYIDILFMCQYKDCKLNMCPFLMYHT